jgi:hypothetical protein
VVIVGSCHDIYCASNSGYGGYMEASLAEGATSAACVLRFLPYVWSC